MENIRFVYSNNLNQEAFNLRNEVFIIEQNISKEDEICNDEYKYIHLLMYIDNIPIGYLRYIEENGNIHLGRVLIKKEYRLKGYGTKLINEVIKNIRIKGYKKIVLASQEHAIAFYKSLGFNIISDMFYDAGIKHYMMSLDL